MQVACVLGNVPGRVEATVRKGSCSLPWHTMCVPRRAGCRPGQVLGLRNFGAMLCYAMGVATPSAVLLSGRGVQDCLTQAPAPCCIVKHSVDGRVCC
jgi:hypothetical protein